MKKFFILLCVLMILPIYAFAANSPTAKTTISCNPSIEFAFAEQTEEWPELLKRIEDIKDETEGFILLEALQITLDKEYEKIEWKLPIEIRVEHEPFILIIDSEAIVKQEVSTTEDGNIITDFTDYEPGIYYVCFYTKGA
jgi:hypothetical protein